MPIEYYPAFPLSFSLLRSMLRSKGKIQLGQRIALDTPRGCMLYCLYMLKFNYKN